MLCFGVIGAHLKGISFPGLNMLKESTFKINKN